MIKRKLTTIFLFCIMIINAQDQNPFYIGHSLVNENMPTMVQELAVNAGKTTHYNKQLINGAALAYQWDHHTNSQGISYQTAFPGGNFNTLVITEAVPLQNHLTWSNTFVKANDFYNYAKNNNNGIPVRFYIYETWHCKNSGIPQTGLPTGCAYDDSANSTLLWHPRLQADFSLWSGIVSHVRNENPSDTEIWMVPVGQAFYNLTTEINAGNVPGITNVFSLFSDDIHLTNAGNYFVACVMYATIYRQSPVGLTANISDQWGNPFANMPTSAQALAMQQVAWNTVTSLNSWSGVSTVLSNQNVEIPKQTASVHPNPAKDYITIDGLSETTDEILIYNAAGVFIKKISTKNKKIKIAELPNGVYYIQIKNNPAQNLKFIKRD